MESVFTALLFILVLLIYFSNKNNKVNRYCALAGFIFWLGVAKECFMYDIVPYLRDVWGCPISSAACAAAYSIMTWALYSLAMPTAVLFSLLFRTASEKEPKAAASLNALIYIPGLTLSFLFLPWRFHEYQLSSRPFWITYSLYNLVFLAAYTYFLISGVRGERPAHTRAQKRSAAMITLPPILYWYFAIFPTHTLEMRGLLKLWQGNVIILFGCIGVYFFMAFRDGSMGLRLTGETYRWDSDMEIISKGAEYTGHMLKNQTTKMEWCIENLMAQYGKSGDEPPEELAILSRSISSLKGCLDKMKRHSESIRLCEEPCSLKALLENVLSALAKTFCRDISVRLIMEDDVRVLCDKSHMEETFANIIINATQAAQDLRKLDITGEYDKKNHRYLLSFTDYGTGMSKEDVKNIFKPYFTTKSTEDNFGLGLSYCKNVVEKHGGCIRVKSEPGKGSTITVELPGKRVIPD